MIKTVTCWCILFCVLNFKRMESAGNPEEVIISEKNPFKAIQDILDNVATHMKEKLDDEIVQSKLMELEEHVTNKYICASSFKLSGLKKVTSATVPKAQEDPLNINIEVNYEFNDLMLYLQGIVVASMTTKLGETKPKVEKWTDESLAVKPVRLTLLASYQRESVQDSPMKNCALRLQTPYYFPYINPINKVRKPMRYHTLFSLTLSPKGIRIAKALFQDRKKSEKIQVLVFLLSDHSMDLTSYAFYVAVNNAFREAVKEHGRACVYFSEDRPNLPDAVPKKIKEYCAPGSA